MTPEERHELTQLIQQVMRSELNGRSGGGDPPHAGGGPSGWYGMPYPGPLPGAWGTADGGRSRLADDVMSSVAGLFRAAECMFQVGHTLREVYRILQELREQWAAQGPLEPLLAATEQRIGEQFAPVLALGATLQVSLEPLLQEIATNSEADRRPSGGGERDGDPSSLRAVMDQIAELRGERLALRNKQKELQRTCAQCLRDVDRLQSDVPPTLEPTLTGLRSGLLGQFMNKGLRVIEPQPGDPYDPTQQQTPSPAIAPGATIRRMLLPGYAWDDEVLLPAQVEA